MRAFAADPRGPLAAARGPSARRGRRPVRGDADRAADDAKKAAAYAAKFLPTKKTLEDRAQRGAHRAPLAAALAWGPPIAAAQHWAVPTPTHAHNTICTH